MTCVFLKYDVPTCDNFYVLAVVLPLVAFVDVDGDVNDAKLVDFCVYNTVARARTVILKKLLLLRALQIPASEQVGKIAIP